MECFFLVAYSGQLYSVESDFQTCRSVEPFLATGCGQDIALGAMFATEKMAPEKRVNLALEAAEKFSAGVRRPSVVLSA